MRVFATPLLLLCACSSYQPLALPGGMTALEGVVEEIAKPSAWIGIEVAPNESDSLEAFEVWTGLRITEVASGSPAERVGIQVGDVLLSFNGVEVNDLGRLENLLLEYRAPLVALKLERGTRIFELDSDVEVLSPHGKQRTLFYVDRILLRAAFRDTPGEGVFPEVAWLAEDSPLQEAGVQVGDRVLSFMGRDPGSSQELVRRLRLLLKPGDRAVFEIGQEGGRKEIDLKTWAPKKVLIDFSLWPLWGWSRDLERDTEDFLIGDLLLVSVFKRSRMGSEIQYTIFSVFSWKTGVALLESSN